MKSLFWMKQIQGSVRVKIKVYVHAWSEFLFISRLVIFNFFPQINHFYCFTSVHGLQDGEITALTWEISSWRLVDKFYIFAFPMYYSLYNWIGEHEITKLQKKYLLRIQRKGHKNKHKKTWMKWNDTKWTIWYFQQRTCVPRRTQRTAWKTTRGQQGVWALKWVSSLERVRSC